MRITTQMLAKASQESGLPLVQGTLLDALHKQNNSINLLDKVNEKKGLNQVSALQENYKKLKSAAEELGMSAVKLYEEGEDSLFGKAEESKDTKDILSEVKNMVEAYNKTLKLLKEADGSLNSYYKKELQSAAVKSADLLQSVGITQKKDGSLSIDEKVLDNTDYDTLKKVFGGLNSFTEVAGYIGVRVAQNAAANAASVSSQYNARGVSQDSFEANKYNFWG